MTPNQKLESELKSWTEENYPVGKKLGYPECCIIAFCNDYPSALKLKCSPGEKQFRLIRFEAAHIDGHYTGFIPCIKCACKIVRKEITINDLIMDRDPDLPPFPELW